MIDFQTVLPQEKQDVLTAFLLKNIKLGNIAAKALDQDCSTRVYYRAKSIDESFIIMDSSLEEKSFLDFIKVQKILIECGLRPPKIIDIDSDNKLLLLEDFGNHSLKFSLDINPNNKTVLYEAAIDSLIKLNKYGTSSQLNDFSHDVLLEGLKKSMIHSYLPHIHTSSTATEAYNELEEIFTTLFNEYNSIKKTIALRDYHAENLMVLGNQALGVIDFQDAMNGYAAYDLVSLLEDARIDVAPDFTSHCINHYLNRSDYNIEEFNYYYSILSAQRNLRILGLFHKFGYLQNKSKYKNCIPRVINYLNLRLKDPILKNLSEWCKKYNILDNDSITK